MNDIMTADQIGARIDEVSMLLADAVPGVDITVDEMSLPDGQPVVFVWAGELDGIVITGVGDDEAVYSTCNEHCDTRRTFVSASDAVRAAIWMSAPAEAIAA